MSADQNQNQDQPLTEKAAEGLFARLLASFAKSSAAPEPQEGKPDASDEPEAQQTASGTDYAAAVELVEKMLAKQAQTDQAFSQLAARHEKLQQDFTALIQRLETEPVSGERAEQTGSPSGQEIGW